MGQKISKQFAQQRFFPHHVQQIQGDALSMIFALCVSDMFPSPTQMSKFTRMFQATPEYGTYPIQVTGHEPPVTTKDKGRFTKDTLCQHAS